MLWCGSIEKQRQKWCQSRAVVSRDDRSWFELFLVRTSQAWTEDKDIREYNTGDNSSRENHQGKVEK